MSASHLCHDRGVHSRQEAAAVLALIVFTLAAAFAAPSRGGIFLILFVLAIALLVGTRDRDE